MASVFRDERKFEQSEPMFRQALAMTERTPQSPLRADVLHEFGNLCRDWNRAAEAESLYQRALELTVQSRGKDHPKYARLLDDMAVLAIAQRKFDDASKLLSTARMIEIERLGPDNGQLGENLWRSAVLERARGTSATAQPLFERSIAILEKTDGASSPALKPVLADYAALLKKMGRLRDATRVEARAATVK
jgi:tetratricopeptide (TPR) repeat protein